MSPRPPPPRCRWLARRERATVVRSFGTWEECIDRTTKARGLVDVEAISGVASPVRRASGAGPSSPHERVDPRPRFRSTFFFNKATKTGVDRVEETGDEVIIELHARLAAKPETWGGRVCVVVCVWCVGVRSRRCRESEVEVERERERQRECVCKGQG